jgi:ORF6N domain
MPAKKSSPAKKLAVLVTLIERRIYLIRRLQVMIDSDLAELYGVETKILNRGVRRNLERFPEDFMFQLTKDEAESLRIQFGTLKPAGRGQHRMLEV